MSSRFFSAARAAVTAAMLAAASPSPAQQTYDVDPEMRIQQLENQLRQLTGQNEELQYRNRQLEERLRQLGASPAPAGQPAAAAIPPQPAPVSRQPQVQQAPYEPQIAAPAPIVQEPPAPQVQGRRRGDAFDPGQNPNAPGAPRTLGGGQSPVANDAAVGAPGGRGPGEPLDLGNVGGPSVGAVAPHAPGATAALTTLPPSATPRDEFDLGIGYMQRKDYALAEEAMR
ncbi:MAG TPA: tol-pal system protein YbgF, partial [Bradyrhizobium sp.]|nr:tol-pal system protein YbgF [Bradyrhizobium sp.]